MLDMSGSSLQQTNHHPAYPILKRFPRSQPIPATCRKVCSSMDLTFQFSSGRKTRCSYVSTDRRQLIDVRHRTWQWLPRYVSMDLLPRSSRDNGSSSVNDLTPNVTPPETSKSPPSAPVQLNSQRGRSSMEHLQQQARAKLADLVKQQYEEEQRERLQPVSPNTPPSSSSNGGRHTTTNATLNDTVGNNASSSTRRHLKESTSNTFASDSALLTAINNQHQQPRPTQGPHAHLGHPASASTSTSSIATAASTSFGESGTLADGGGSNDDGTTSYDPQLEWAALKAEFAEDWRRVGEQWRRFLSRPLDPPPLSPWQVQQQQQPQGSLPSALSGAPGASSPAGPHTTTTPQDAPTATAAAAWSHASPNPDGNSSNSSIVSSPEAALSDGLAAALNPSDDVTPAEHRRPGTPMSWLLLAALVATFAAQWAPLAQRLAADGWPVGQELTIGLAVLLACPPSPLSLLWQADAITAAAGDWGCLLTSSLLHSGLISLGAAISSLQETAPWLEALHGFMIMIITYSMAGLGASLGQMCVAGQTTGLAGLGAAVGMEAAVCVRYWRTTGGPQPPTTAGLVLLAVAGLSAAYQPLVGTWGILGGLLGGALSGVLAYDVLYCMRVVLALSILTGLAVWNVLTWIPRQIWRLVVLMATAVWGTAGALVAAIRAL